MLYRLSSDEGDWDMAKFGEMLSFGCLQSYDNNALVDSQNVKTDSQKIN